MRSTLLIFRGGSLGEKKETAFNERIAEKEKDGWEVVEMQTTRPSFGQGGPVVILRLARESN